MNTAPCSACETMCVLGFLGPCRVAGCERGVCFDSRSEREDILDEREKQNEHEQVQIAIPPQKTQQSSLKTCAAASVHAQVKHASMSASTSEAIVSTLPGVFSDHQPRATRMKTPKPDTKGTDWGLRVHGGPHAVRPLKHCTLIPPPSPLARPHAAAHDRSGKVVKFSGNPASGLPSDSQPFKRGARLKILRNFRGVQLLVNSRGTPTRRF
jgi:hypothetical protein